MRNSSSGVFDRIFISVSERPRIHSFSWLWRALRSVVTQSRRSGPHSLPVFVLLACLFAGSLAGCAVNRRPVQITEPTRIEAQRPRGRDVPHLGLRWYNDFWHAISDGNLKVAWIIADSRDERRFVDALETMLNGDVADAEPAVAPLLTSNDTIVRRAARITYGALLSANGHWARLANFADSLSDSTARALRDDAGVERWAPAFRSISTHASFIDTVAAFPLVRSSTGTPIIPVAINGVTKHFWLDTGSSITIVSSSAAAQCNVTPLESDTLELLTAVGRLPARPATIHLMRVGGLEITDAPAMIIDASALGMRNGDLASVIESIDGVIGFDVIRTLDITIDDVNQRVTIRRPVRVESKVPHNLSWFGVPVVTMLSEKGSALHITLDTGADETFGTLSLVTKTGAHWVPAERRRVRGFGGSILERGLVVPSVRLFLGDVPLDLERVFLYDAQYPSIFVIDGTLGADLGRGGVLRIDMTNGRLEVRPQ